MVKTFSTLYLDARREFLKTEDPDTASRLARDLLCFVSGKSKEQVLTDREKYACEDVCQTMEDAVRRIVAGEPLAYVLGEWEFYGLKMYVDRNVLIPRDDTCAVTALAVKRGLFLDQDPRILDLCTGSGCIGIAVASRVKDAKVTLADVSREALAVARKNIALHKLSGRVSCVQADALAAPSAFLGKFDMIVSNPPYVTAEEMEALPESVKNYEPHLALYGGRGQFPLFFYPLLMVGAWVYFHTVGPPLRRILTALGRLLRRFFRLVCLPFGLLSKKSKKLKKYLFSSGRKWVRIKSKRKHSAPMGCTTDGGTQDET